VYTDISAGGGWSGVEWRQQGVKKDIGTGIISNIRIII